MTSTPYYEDDSVTLFHGDCLEVLASLPDGSVDAVVTDPPYGLEFMGKDWDAPWKSAASHAEARTRRAPEMGDESKRPFIAAGVNKFEAGKPFQAWCESWAVECLRVLKPGGHILAFGGTRTWHRLACAVEDAGFEVRDSIAWLYGSGFPKSLDVSKAIDKAAGAEREVVGTAKGASNGSVVGLGSRRSLASEYDITAPATDAARTWQGWGTALKPAFEPVVVARKPLAGTVAANVLAHGTGALNIDACRIGTETLPAMTRGVSLIGTFEGADGNVTPERSGRWPANVVLDTSQAAALDKQSGTLTSGSRQPGTYAGLGYTGSDHAEFPGIDGSQGGASRFFYVAKAPGHERPRDGDGTAHPTVKPVDLMRWLVRLVTPPCGTVLDPFAGSGTTAEACVIEGFQCITIEREPTYLPLIVQRLSKPIALDLFGAGA